MEGSPRIDSKSMSRCSSMAYPRPARSSWRSAGTTLWCVVTSTAASTTQEDESGLSWSSTAMTRSCSHVLNECAAIPAGV